MPQSNMKVGMISSDKRKSGIANYSRNLREQISCELLSWDFEGKINVIMSPIKNFFKFKKFIENNDITHIQYHLGEQGPLFLPLLWLMSGNVVVTMHEDHFHTRFSGFWIWWHNIWLKRVNGITIHTEFHRGIFNKHLGPKTFVITFGVKKMGKSEIKNINKHTITIPGFINRWKGIDVAISAMPHVLKKFPDATLHIVGKIWDKKYELELQQQIENLRLEKSVFIVSNFITPEQYHEFMKQSAIVVLPYRRTTMSNVLAEAIGYEKEIVVSDILPFLEYTEGKVHIFTSGDSKDLAKTIMEVFRGKRSEIGKLAEKYSWPKIAKKHMKIYNSIVTKQPK